MPTLPPTRVPEIRVRAANEHAAGADGKYVLYWMIANRRPGWNFALQRAVDWATYLDRPLVILEALSVDYPWASDRLHQFVIQGMADNQRAFAQAQVTYHPYVEPEANAGRGLVRQLASEACVVLTDDFPCFFLPRIVASLARQVPVRCEAVDSNGLLPLRAADKVYPLAHSFRRFLQKSLRPHLERFPDPSPLDEVRLRSAAELPRELLKRWPATDVAAAAHDPAWLQTLPIDHGVPRSPIQGGHRAALARQKQFVDSQLPLYGDRRNHPDDDAASGLSPYLHFGHVSAHQVFRSVMQQDRWSPKDLAPKPTGSREGWWGASPETEAFLDQLITWRELGYNMCWQREDYDQYSSLPVWAQRTLADHQQDPREFVYCLEEFAQADTHDPLWNAAQRQLVQEGRIHNYLRMLWGKKILHWTRRPETALEIMIELNNRYALDGRNPNSYSGIFWVLGRYDRAWGPERKIFGKVRYMTSENTARKVRLKQYLAQFGPA